MWLCSFVFYFPFVPLSHHEWMFGAIESHITKGRLYYFFTSFFHYHLPISVKIEEIEEKSVEKSSNKQAKESFNHWTKDKSRNSNNINNNGNKFNWKQFIVHAGQIGHSKVSLFLFYITCIYLSSCVNKSSPCENCFSFSLVLVVCPQLEIVLQI